MILKSVFSKCASARGVRNFSSRRRQSGGRDFSSSSLSPEGNLGTGMSLLFAASLLGGAIVYCVTDIVRYNINSGRFAKMEEESDKVRDLFTEKYEKHTKRRDELWAKEDETKKKKLEEEAAA